VPTKRSAAALATLAATKVALASIASIAAGEVSGRATSKAVVGVVQIVAVLVRQQVGVHLVQGKVLAADGERGDEAVVVGAKANKDVREAAAGRSQPRCPPGSSSGESSLPPVSPSSWRRRARRASGWHTRVSWRQTSSPGWSTLHATSPLS
jgi:hypothetical protein